MQNKGTVLNLNCNFDPNNVSANITWLVARRTSLQPSEEMTGRCCWKNCADVTLTAEADARSWYREWNKYRPACVLGCVHSSVAVMGTA